MVEKITKWREAVVKLKRDIPSDDDVLCSWIAKIEDFGIDLPLLLELSSVSLKVHLETLQISSDFYERHFLPKM